MTDLAEQLRTDAEAYRQSLAEPDTNDMFSLAYQWQDKKHRHVYDLCGKLETAADRIEKLEAALTHIYAWYPISITHPHQTIEEIGQFARKALEDKDD